MQIKEVSRWIYQEWQESSLFSKPNSTILVVNYVGLDLESYSWLIQKEKMSAKLAGEDGVVEKVSLFQYKVLLYNNKWAARIVEFLQ